MKINRRQFIIYSAASTGVALTGNWFREKIFFSSALSQWEAKISPIYQSQDGLLELNLEAKESLVNLAGKPASVLTYNGQIPAPRLEAKPGDRVRIHFSNNLTQPTNIHYHGLHIPITENADNVFLKIPPGKKLTYEFSIPFNHLSGTFWYHPHLHGLVAEQLFGGLAGLFIVRGELDEIPEIKAAKEEFLVLQDFALDGNGQLASSMNMSLMEGREGDLVTVNGEVNPVFSFPKNGLLRLRILNASPSRFYRLMLKNYSFYQIATDGGALERPQKITELLLVPGQRADVLIKSNGKSQTDTILNLPYKRGRMGMMMGKNQPDIPLTLATIQDNESATNITLPTKLVSISQLPKPTRTRSFELNHGMTPGMGMAFLINGQPYNKDTVNTEVKLNTVEDWEIINTGVMDHPFHVHGSAFQVISRNNKPESLLAWRDTILVSRGETVRIRIPFRDFAGKTVYHCHILDHEDLGMMGTLQIQA